MAKQKKGGPKFVRLTAQDRAHARTPRHSQSIRKTRFFSVTYCHTLVCPGMGATVQAFEPLSALMMEDLPTLG